MDCTTKMESNKSSAIVAFIIGVCLRLPVSTSIKVDLVTYNGNVGHATSYNYPFKHTYGPDTYTYRLFTDNGSPQKLCLTFRQFEMSYNSIFTINVKTSGGTMQYYDYTWHGEGVNHPPNSTLPDNIWKEPFCVNLAGDTSLMFTFRTQSHTQLPGFYLEYQTTTPQTNAQCGSGLFTCYNRECVNDRYICKNETACTDMSHNTFAHAFCMNKYSAPIQQSGFWANDLDKGNADGITADVGWWLDEEIVYPFVGPPSDHTGGGKFLYTKFSSTCYDLKMTFYPGKLVQKENCLSFWYYIAGRDLGELVAEWGISKVWERSGSYGAKWLQAQVNLFCESGVGCDKQVKITASRGSNPDTRISVDDISVMPGLCPFYEADMIRDAWTTNDGCTFITHGKLSCSSLSGSSARTKSWLVSRGKCLVGDVEFDFNTNPTQTVMVYKYPVDGSEVKLKTIRQSTAHQTVQFKIPIDLSVPAKIGFTTIFNKGRISLEKIHVVDNECDNLSFVDDEVTKVYPSPVPSPFPTQSPARYANTPAIGTVIGVIVAVCAVCVSIATVAVFLHQYCRSKCPAPPQSHRPPTYSECVSPTAPHLGQASNPPHPPPYTGQGANPPPYNQQLPPAYGEVCGNLNNHI